MIIAIVIVGLVVFWLVWLRYDYMKALTEQEILSNRLGVIVPKVINVVNDANSIVENETERVNYIIEYGVYIPKVEARKRSVKYGRVSRKKRRL